MKSFVCPRCKGGLEVITSEELQCPQDGLVFRCVDGIWRFLLPERESRYVRFIADYEAVRRGEGRGSRQSDYYRALPFQDISEKFSADWKIRAASFRALVKIINSFAPQNRPPLEIVDLGAGNGWLSNRLALQGYQVSAVDLLVNSEDGLGAWKHYESKFFHIQAEFINMPFSDGFVSLIVFNASFHYSENYEETLAEALRVLCPDGWIVIMDSPVYHSFKSGEQMVVERKANFLSNYGIASDSIKSENYLTYQQINELANKLGIHWRHVRPFYGFRWALRPWLARLRGRREPAEFGLWVGQR